MAYTVEFIARLRDDVTGKLKGMSAATKELQSNLKAGFVDGVRSALPEQLGYIADGLEKLPVGALAAVGAIAAVGKVAIDTAMQVSESALAFDKLSQKTGESVEFLSTLDAAARDADVGTEQLSLALQTLTRNLEAAGAGNVSVRQELFALSDLFQTMPDGPQKTALAMQAFGKSGADLIPLLNQGSQALRDNMQAQAALGRVITAETVAAANALDDSIDRLNANFEGMKNNVGSAVIPALVSVSDTAFKAGADVTTLSQSMADWFTRTAQGIPIVDALGKAIFGVAPATSAASQGVDALGDSSSAATSAMATMGPTAKMNAAMARSAAAIFYQAAQGFAAGVKLMDSSRASAARYAGMARDIQYEQGLVVAKSNSANASRYAAQAEVYRVEAMGKATRQTDMLTVATDAMNRGLDWSASSAGGAAAAVDEVTDSVKELQEAQRSVGGMLGQSLTEMDELARVQTAYALATGELSAEQFAQQQAMKALMQATKDKQVSEDKAVTTAMALAQGLASVSDVYAIAGPAGQRFADEQGKVQGAAEAATTKVNEMATAIKKIPNNYTVDVVATVLGMGAVQNAKKVLDDLHDRQYTAYVNVVYRQTGSVPAAASGGGGVRAGGESGRAMGGSVSAGSPYMVGENGPEVIVPNTNGQVIPNHRLGDGSGRPVVVQVNLDSRVLARSMAQHLR